MANAHIENDGSNLAAALVAFQAEPPKVEKDAYNPAFKSNFTSLEELTNKALPALNKHGLAYTVTSEITEKGMAIIGTLLHTSGERLSAAFPVTDTNPQKIGSAFTYGRRYLLAALTGIVVDADDDGNAASNPSPAERQIQKAASRTTPRPANDAPAQAEVREWIGGDAGKKAAANAAYEKIKKDQGLTGDALWAAVKAEVIK